jgi:23S rRNA (uracil1939-C5)-methyltransferase
MSKHRSSIQHTPINLQIESVDLDANGIAKHDGKVIFVDGALSQETVSAEITKRKPSYEKAKITHIHQESAYRVKPKCVHYGVCGGCSMQHMDMAFQVAIKQRALEDQLWHLGKVKPEQVLTPVVGHAWNYRHRARISARFVVKKNKMLLGFHEKSSSYVADLHTCQILAEPVASLMPSLRQLLETLSIYTQIPQVEVAVGDHCTALVLRILAPLSTKDEQDIRTFVDQQTFALQIWLQPSSPDSIFLFYQNGQHQLAYDHPEFQVSIDFMPSDFTQINHAMNRVLVKKAIDLLDVQPHHRILDLFCGIGNFTLPLARKAKEVIGIEGSTTLTQRAQKNADKHKLTNVSFFARNLFDVMESVPQKELLNLGLFDRWLIDPPREGAFSLVQMLALCVKPSEKTNTSDDHLNETIQATQSTEQTIESNILPDILPDIRPEKIVYVSCNPSTLARDADFLVHQAGYILKSVGIANMFPHTSHVESIAVFEKIKPISNNDS